MNNPYPSNLGLSSNYSGGHFGSMINDILSGLSVGKVPGWMVGKRVATRVGDEPIMKALHFNNCAARWKAQRAINELKASKTKGKKITKAEVKLALRPFIHYVPVWRGTMLKQEK